ncbi:hypothetical protein [Microcystis phage Mel-JY01]
MASTNNNIIDTLDNTTLNLLEQSRLLANQNGNVLVSNAIESAIRTALLTSAISGSNMRIDPPPPNVGTNGTSGILGGPRGDVLSGLGDGNVNSNGIDTILFNNSTAGTSVIGTGVGVTGSRFIDNRTDRINVDTSNITNVIGNSTSGGNNFTGISLGGGGVSVCSTVIRRLTNFRERQVRITNFTEHYGGITPDEFLGKDVTMYECEIVADVEECCIATRNTLNSTIVPAAQRSFTRIKTGVVIAKSKPSGWYKQCETDGMQSYYESIYKVSDIFPINDSEVLSNSISPGSPIVLWGNVCDETLAFLTFDEYKIGNQQNRNTLVSAIANALQRTTRTSYSIFVPRVSAFVNSEKPMQSLNATSPSGRPFEIIQSTGNVPIVIMAGCFSEGNCIKERKDIKEETPCNDTDTWQYSNSVTFTSDEFSNFSIPNNYVIVNSNPTSNVNTVEEVSNIFETIPGNECNVGNKKIVKTITSRTYSYRYSNPNSPNCNFSNKFVTVISESVSQPQWVNIRFDESKRGTPECSCLEIYETPDYPNPITILDPDSVNGCRQYNIVKVMKKCPGNNEYILSTDIYTDGVPASILNLIPRGHRLDPYEPFTVRANCNDDKIRIYHPLILGKDIVEAKVNVITSGLFKSAQSMSCYLTSSIQSSNTKKYYYDVVDCDCNSTPYFSVAYGNVNGSGSLWSEGETNDTPTRAIYSQYRLLALEEPERKFKFKNSGIETESNDIYVLNFYRNALSDRIDPGNFEIPLKSLSTSAVHTFIDNSGDTSQAEFCSQDPYVSYDLVSGSLNNGIHSSGIGSNITTYGKFYPNLGVIIFDPAKMDSLLAFSTNRNTNTDGNNAFKLFQSISGSSVGGSPRFIKARNVRYKNTNHYFIRVPASQANYSNNPTYVTGSGNVVGEIQNQCFKKDPVTYVTSVGLYDDKKNLLAVAKLSKPVKKTSDDELTLKIRLNW